MCGIFVWINKRRGVVYSNAVKAIKSLRHRGPDASTILYWSGSENIRNSGLRVAGERNNASPENIHMVFGHSRLSIIDLSENGAQPMSDQEGTTLIFNGTIYNYIELRRQLEKEGQVFQSSSDTEVLLHWLRRKNIGGIGKLNGSWAFACFNSEANTLLLSRDPYGERPLYYFEDEENFIAASEIKAIYCALDDQVRRFDKGRIAAYIAHQNWSNVDPSRTVYTDIRRLVPGSSLVFDLGCHRYSIQDNNGLKNRLESVPKKSDIREELFRAVEIRLRSDVPLGVFVSGGIDSSFIAAAVCEMSHGDNDVTFYTAKLPEGTSNDLKYARMVADSLGITLREIDVPIGIRGIEQLRKLSRQYDQPVPFAGTTFTESIVYETMARDGIRVSLNGTGGDEVFGGYGNEYIEGVICELLSQRKFGALLGIVSNAIKNGWTSLPALAIMARNRIKGRRPPNSGLLLLADSARDAFSDIFRKCGEYYWANDSFSMPLPEMQRRDSVYGRLANYVLYADSNAMMNSIESRSPFLDPTLAKYMDLPAPAKYHERFNKYALREAMPSSVPSDVTWRAEKQGFTFPFEAFYREHRAEMVKQISANEMLNTIFDIPKLNTRLRKTPIERDVILHMYALSVFTEEYPCTVTN